MRGCKETKIGERPRSASSTYSPRKTKMKAGYIARPRGSKMQRAKHEIVPDAVLGVEGADPGPQEAWVRIHRCESSTLDLSYVVSLSEV